MAKIIDLRSDTVTIPTEKMRKAMAEAEVGDDVYGDDPTINELERMGALILGKEKALFVPSGSMGNQLAIMGHTRAGDEIIVGEDSHIVVHEVGGAARLSGVNIRTVHNGTGSVTKEDIIRLTRGEDIHFPRTSLVCMENALASGTIVPLKQMEEVYNTAKEKGLRVHTDGARIFNAAVALGVDVKEITKHTDTVMACLSKGLGAPVGSLLAGDGPFIDEARKNRKLLGGAMRQVGVLGAAGLIALLEMRERLTIDHKNAKYLGEELLKIKGIELQLTDIQINMVFFKCTWRNFDGDDLISYLLSHGIKVNGYEMDGIFRFVTHLGITKEDIDTVISTIQQYLDERGI